jgi:hypothetical protein
MRIQTHTAKPKIRRKVSKFRRRVRRLNRTRVKSSKRLEDIGEELDWIERELVALHNNFFDEPISQTAAIIQVPFEASSFDELT